MTTTARHIILIISDDHGYADRSGLGIHPQVRTPHLDRWSTEGVEYTQAYITAPVCSPSRAGFMTGTHQARWGAHWFGLSHLPDGVTTMAEELRGQGYRTAYLGKVHYGPERRGDRGAPPQHGFDRSYYGLAGQQSGRLNYLRHSQGAVSELGEFAARASAVYPMLQADDDGEREVELDGFLTAELGARARAEIAQADRDGVPLFLVLAFNAVHNFCWQLPVEELRRRGLPALEDFSGDENTYLEWYEGSISPNLQHGREYYLAQLELMDAEIGGILDELDAREMTSDTLIAYLTDNGGSPCNFGDNTPLRGSKYTLWEGGIRTPMLVRWPAGGFTGGGRGDAPVTSLDLAVTAMFAGGVALERLAERDGEVLTAAGAGSDRVLHWHCGFQSAVRAGEWKLLLVDDDAPEVGHLEQIEHATLSRGTALYNLAEDPGETTDVADRHPDVVERLRRLHEDFLAEAARDEQRLRTVAT